VSQAKVRHLASGRIAFSNVHVDESGKALISKGWQVVEVYKDNNAYQIAYNADQDAKEEQAQQG